MTAPMRKDERDYYRTAERARQYDERTLQGSSVERQRSAARTVARYLQSGQVLDIGCGSARMLIEMARLLPGLRFTGIDVSGEMVRLGRGNIKRVRLESRIVLDVVPAEGLAQYADGTFDMVMSHGSFSGWLEPERSLAEIRRMLVPGGLLFISDWCRSAPREALAPYLESAASPEHTSRIEMAYATSYAEEEFRQLLRMEGMEPLELGRDGLWISAVLRKTATR